MKNSRIALIVVAGIGALMLVAAVVLSTWTIPAPSTKVERVIPNDRFSR
ncbi:MAG: hypothetical protein HYR63_28710 [Proteobacteria bacterium]|nr:hypothetical protein [Pseudomonadota bacterium]MBI3496831.1 hypothetical protein [Pseudomonadota bacterium]